MKMLTELPESRQKLLAVGLLLILLLMIAQLIIVPIVSSYVDHDERIDQLTTRLDGYRRIAANAGSLDKSIKKLMRQITSQETGYFRGATEALAAAEMQGYVKQVVDSNNGTVTSIQMLQEQQEPGETPKVSIKVQMNGSITTLQKVFHALESGQPTVFLDNIYLRSRGAYMFRPNQKTSDQLDVRFTVYGYYKTKVE